ncbi:DUF1080 domain-containing protein [Desulfovibrio sulfodismutans]|uniref:DUF1080 domain-containing protein n=1 Tax=Desulfolutivibrio sulfodismutans TaxID=63561 RepID=A0A7K3NP65_9BACT|nr:C10 family peptidase [Desulfolutivibrio sulfodismutans]NDY57988.1 DUF1080 domain-containing protein [Desulfolutivibrio sulfodismutans]
MKVWQDSLLIFPYVAWSGVFKTMEGLTMKRGRGAVCFFVALCLFPALLLASPTTPEQASQVVAGWLSLEAGPMKTDMGKTAMSVSRYDGPDGQAAYYIVSTNPKGFVIVPADDEVEPIIGFSPDGVYDPSPKTPLGALVSQDVPGRVAFVRQEELKKQEALTAGVAAKARWDTLSRAASQKNAVETGTASISDVWVAPLVQSTWDQDTAGGVNTYNIYTPNNYVCGCVATAMAQLMRFHQHPTTGVGTASFDISVCGSAATRALRGGNGSGGAYSWSDMVLSPGASTTTAQRQAIGALTADAGVSVNMDYCSDASGTDTLYAASAFRNTFGYSNAMRGLNNYSNLPTANRNAMVNPNLDAGYPVLFGITGDGGHAIVGDGYGYDSSTMYHHLNMGWSGSNNLWYNLPTIDTTYYNFNSVYKCVYNVYKTGTGEIISGRVTNSTGTPIAGATVTATRSGGGTYTDTTDAKGIYALSKVPSASNYTISVSKAGYTFTSKSATTGTSTNDTITTGNVWGVNFTGSGSGSGGGVNLMPLDIPTVVGGGSSGGFNEQFTGTLGNWTQYNGPWSISSGAATVSSPVMNKFNLLQYTSVNFQNFDYSVRMKRSVVDEWANVILLRATPTPLDEDGLFNSGYYFGFTTDGYFNVSRMDNGSWNSYTGWLTSAAIKGNDWNVLRVTASGSSLKFYMNETLLYSVTDSTYSTGKVGFGFYAGAAGTFMADYATLSPLDAVKGDVSTASPTIYQGGSSTGRQ